MLLGFSRLTQRAPPDGNSCIYCLNTDELMSVWNTIKDFDDRKGRTSNWSRLTSATCGDWKRNAVYSCFADYNWDIIDYPMDRILLPFSGYPSYPTGEIIYPKHKSRIGNFWINTSSLKAPTFTNER